MITGATDGIGRETALQLAKQKFHVIIVSRNEIKCRQTCENLIEDSGNENIEFYTADLSLMADIKNLVNTLKQCISSLDVLINNAGALFNNRLVTSEGFEKTFALNHLNYFHLSLSLMCLLKESKNARIVNVASGAHFGAELDMDDLQSENKYNGLQVYRKSKLMNILFTYALAKKLNDTKYITVNCLHPGFVASAFGHNNGFLFRNVLKIYQKLKAISVREGAKTSVYLAADPDVDSISGRYFDQCREKQSSEISYDKNLQKDLWKKSEASIYSIN